MYIIIFVITEPEKLYFQFESFNKVLRKPYPDEEI